MDALSASLDPVAAQQLVARYATLVDEQTRAQTLPAAESVLPAPKPDIKRAIGVVLETMAATHQLNDDLELFLEDAYVALASYVDEDLAAVAAEHRHASDALDGEALEILRASASEGCALRAEFHTLVGEVQRLCA